MADIFIKHM